MIKRLFKWLLLGGFLLLGVLIAALEIHSQLLLQNQEPQPERVFLACDPARYPPDPEKKELLDALVEKKRQGLPITKEDLDQAMYLVPSVDMEGVNGVVCSEMIFVSERLPWGARYYVARHELEHIFQFAGVSGEYQDMEFSAHWAAAKDFPLGMVQTVISSLIGAYQLMPSPWYFLLNCWIIFKAYFLGIPY